MPHSCPWAVMPGSVLQSSLALIYILLHLVALRFQPRWAENSVLVPAVFQTSAAALPSPLLLPSVKKKIEVSDSKYSLKSVYYLILLCQYRDLKVKCYSVNAAGWVWAGTSWIWRQLTGTKISLSVDVLNPFWKSDCKTKALWALVLRWAHSTDPKHWPLAVLKRSLPCSHTLNCSFCPCKPLPHLLCASSGLWACVFLQLMFSLPWFCQWQPWDDAQDPLHIPCVLDLGWQRNVDCDSH